MDGDTEMGLVFRFVFLFGIRFPSDTVCKLAQARRLPEERP